MPHDLEFTLSVILNSNKVTVYDHEINVEIYSRLEKILLLYRLKVWYVEQEF